MTKMYKLKQPMLGWAKGEHFRLDTEWGEWTRRKTGETFNTRGSIGEGEIALLLDWLTQQHSFIELLGEQSNVKGTKNEVS